jgi:formylglycine-generating enzyme required for sulfatase activity
MCITLGIVHATLQSARTIPAPFVANYETRRKVIYMKKILIILVLILVSFKLSATGKLNDTTYFDNTEIDVKSWLSFYSWTLKNNGIQSAKEVLPDSSAIEPELWLYIKKGSKTFINDLAGYSLQPIGYFDRNCDDCLKHFGKRLFRENRYCAMLNFPITGITYDQAVKFCEWRSKVDEGDKYYYRLPSPEEWKAIAMLGLTKQEQKNRLMDSLYNSYPRYNYKLKCNCDNDSIHGKLQSFGGFPPDKNRAFDLFGNVSEMTSEKGIAKGGNFNLYARQCNVDSIQIYSKPEKWLGFRCVAIKKKK